MSDPHVTESPEAMPALGAVSLLAGLVEKWKGIAARQREYGKDFPPTDRIHFTTIANAFEACAKDLECEITRPANTKLRHAVEAPPQNPNQTL